MFGSILPQVEQAEENTSAFHPTGMLDRDQRTTSIGLNLTRKNQGQSSANCQSHLHHHRQYNFDANSAIVSEESCMKQTKDNSETFVTCAPRKNLRKFDDNRSRTKFPVASRILAWIIFFTINITFSKAGPLRLMDESSNEFLCKQTSLNIQTTNYSMGNLDAKFQNYLKVNNRTPESVDQWNHYGAVFSNKPDVAKLFNGNDFTTVFTKTLTEIHGYLSTIRDLLNFYLCQHRDERYEHHTLHIMSLDNLTNIATISNLQEILVYTKSSIVQIEEINDELKKLEREDKVNCLLKPNTSLHAEVITMKQLNGTLIYMSNFLNYINKTYCMAQK